MLDFNKLPASDDIKSGTVNVVVEIPIGNIKKIEWNKNTKQMEVDRLEPTDFPEPSNYGFIPQTVSGDGDNLDVLIVSETKLSTGTVLSAKVIGIMKFEDENEVDDKIVVVPNDESIINTLNDLPQDKIDQISYHFSHYKDQIKSGSTIIKGWGDAEEARKIILQSIDRWNSPQN